MLITSLLLCCDGERERKCIFSCRWLSWRDGLAYLYTCEYPVAYIIRFWWARQDSNNIIFSFDKLSRISENYVISDTCITLTYDDLCRARIYREYSWVIVRVISIDTSKSIWIIEIEGILTTLPSHTRVRSRESDSPSIIGSSRIRYIYLLFLGTEETFWCLAWCLIGYISEFHGRCRNRAKSQVYDTDREISRIYDHTESRPRRCSDSSDKDRKHDNQRTKNCHHHEIDTAEKVLGKFFMYGPNCSHTQILEHIFCPLANIEKEAQYTYAF